MMMKYVTMVWRCLVLLFLITGCAAPERVIYFQDLQAGLQEDIAQSYEIKMIYWELRFQLEIQNWQFRLIYRLLHIPWKLEVL